MRQKKIRPRIGHEIPVSVPTSLLPHYHPTKAFRLCSVCYENIILNNNNNGQVNQFNYPRLTSETATAVSCY